jgi:hypothetical protein
MYFLYRYDCGAFKLIEITRRRLREKGEMQEMNQFEVYCTFMEMSQ